MCGIPSIESVTVNRNARHSVAAVLILVAMSVAVWSCSSNPAAEPEPDPTATPTRAAPSATPEATRAAPAEVPVQGLEGAQQALREGRFEEAAAAYEEAAATAGDDIAVASAWLGAGVAWNGAGQTGQAIEALEQAAGAAPEDTQVWRRVRYVLGLRLTDAGQVDEAVNALRPISEASYNDPLQPLVDTAFGRASALSGELAVAEAAWLRALDSPFTTSTVRATILRDRARVAESRGDAQGAVNLYAELVNVTGAPSDRFVLAEAALTLGDSVTWEEQLRAVISFNSGSLLAVRALDELEASGREVDPGDAGYVLYQRRRYSEAAARFEAALEDETLAPADRAFRLYYLAASLEDDGFWADSVPIYDSVKDADPTSPYVHRAAYWAARAHESLEDFETASARYETLVAEGPAGDFTEESAFRAGYTLFRAGDPEGGVLAWERLQVSGDPRTLYWKGRAQLEIGDTNGASESFEAAIAAGPLEFYGVEAARQLGTVTDPEIAHVPVQEPADPDWDAIATWLANGTATAAPPAPETAAADLLAVGEITSAQQVLMDQPMEPLQRVRVAHELGLTSVAAREATILLYGGPTAPQSAPGDLLRIAYPLDYVASLNRETFVENVDPLFMAALIRTESYWDTNAVSIAFAYGLTQVIEPTGEAIAAALGFSDWTTRDLFKPAVSIRFGANYIASQLRRFETPYAALAAYNAGPGNAERWSNATIGQTPADFVEAVDFAETRHYIEIVMTSYAYYRLAHR